MSEKPLTDAEFTDLTDPEIIVIDVQDARR